VSVGPHNGTPSRRQRPRRSRQEPEYEPPQRSLSESKVVQSLYRPPPPRPSLHPPAQQFPDQQTPGVASHLVSAHPPCSRKGPLLPACGLKCPRRVKRETTNSRFSFQGNSGKFSVDSPVPRPSPTSPVPVRGPSESGTASVGSSGGGTLRVGSGGGGVVGTAGVGKVVAVRSESAVGGR
jgi:hypothetical protein